MAHIIVIIVLDAVTVLMAVRNLSDRPGWRWAVHPLFFFPWILLLMFLTGGYAVSWAGGTGLSAIGMGMLFCIALAAPQGLLIVAFFSHHLSQFFTYGGKRNIAVEKTCDQAEAAEKAGRFTEAEERFREALAGEAEEKDEKKRMLWAPVHLRYGNFLQRRGRLREAVREWEAALRGGLDPARHLVTALRASDIMLQQLQDREAAVRILQAAVTRYPRENETRSLRRRLETIQERSPAAAPTRERTP